MPFATRKSINIGKSKNGTSALPGYFFQFSVLFWVLSTIFVFSERRQREQQPMIQQLKIMMNMSLYFPWEFDPPDKFFLHRHYENIIGKCKISIVKGCLLQQFLVSSNLPNSYHYFPEKNVRKFHH